MSHRREDDSPRRRRASSDSKLADGDSGSSEHRESSQSWRTKRDYKRSDQVHPARDRHVRRQDDLKRESRRSANSRDRDDRPLRHSYRHRSRSRSLTDDRVARRRRSRSKSPRRSKKRRSRSRSHSISPVRRSKRPLPSQDESFRERNTDGEVQKKKPNFGSSGLLAKEANTVAGTSVVLKYHEPPEARKPPASQDWRLFIFKGKDLLETVPLSAQTCWLMGKEAAVADLVIEHPSTSKQHAVIQFRYIEKVINEFGDKKGNVKPFVIDLESSNGTKLNDEKISPRRFIEIKSGDVMKIGSSDREYVFILPPKE